MREFKYDYTISKENNPTEFKKICKIISDMCQDFIASKLLIDVDGSTIQVYSKENQQIVVYDDYDIGAVFVKSDIDLSAILSDTKAA